MHIHVSAPALPFANYDLTLYLAVGRTAARARARAVHKAEIYNSVNATH